MIKTRLYKYFLLYVLLIVSSCSAIRNKLTFYPNNSYITSNNRLGQNASEIYIKTPDNENLQTLYLCDPSRYQKKIVIYFHGNGGNLYHRLYDAKKIFDMGVDVLLLSYRGYAKSSGNPSEKGIYIDGETVVKYAVNTLGYHQNNISLFGRSLGATVAIHVAQKQNFRALVLVTPLTSGKDMLKSKKLGVLGFIAGDSYNSYNKINNIICPILVIHGTKDEIVPYYMGEKLYNKYNGIKQFSKIENGKHNNLENINPKKYWGSIRNFLMKENSL